MKLAITGKGGVGKTTLSSMLARLYAAEGKSVLAIDANPDANLGMALGIPSEELSRVTPIAEMADLIEERTGARPGSGGGFFRLNPRVDDIPERFSASKDGIKLLVMGSVKQGGGGCMCPESSLLKALIRHLLVGRSEVVIMDMDAGVEHLGRGTAGAVDAFIVVVEPGRRSFQTAQAVHDLARDLGITKVYLVGNKVTSESDRLLIAQSLPDFEVLGFVNQNPKIREADLQGLSPFDMDAQVVEEVKQIKERLDQLSKQG